MTRKKSNVKALALAVTCAILAGGYSGLNPVYAAADTLYKEGNNVTTSSTPSVTGGGSNTEITELTVGGVTIGGTGGDAGQIIAKNIVGITNSSEGTVNDIHINGAIFASGGAITANGGLTTNSVNIGGLTISSLASGSTTSATNYIAGIKDSSGAVTAIGISGTKFENNGAITASSLKLDDGIHSINNVAEAIGNNKDNITTLQTKTTNISYNATTGTTVDGVVLKDKGITAADGKFTVYEEGKTVFKGDATDNGSTTIKAGETVVKGANGTVTINNSGINIAQKEQDTNKDLSITLDSGYVKASGYVQAPKFYIDNNNVFEKEADGTSRLTVSDVGENGEVTKFVRIGGGNILASGDVNVAGSLNTNTIGEATTGTGVTVEDVKFKAGAVSGVKSINDKIKFSDDGTVTSINGGIKISPDGKTVTFNENNPTGQVQISEKGIKVGTGSTYTIAGVGFAANNVSGINNLTATGTIQGATLKVNDSNLLDSNGLTAIKAVIGNLTIDGASITSNNADGSVGVAGVTVNNAGALNNVTSIDGVAVAGNAASGLTIGSGATAVTIGGNSLALSSTGFNVDDDGDVTGKSFKVNGSNYLDSTGLTTGKAVIGGVNTLNDKGIDTSKNLHVGGQATFGDSTGTHTTINGGTITSTDGTDSTTIGPNKITTKTLEADTIILKDHMQDGAGNKIEIGADGHLNVAGNNFTIDTIGQMRNEYTGTDAAGRATKTTLKTSVDGINANYTNSVNNNNNLLNINQDGVALGVTDSSNNNLGMLSADAEKATMGYGTANSIVVNKDTIKSALGTDVTRVMTNSTTEQSIVDKVGAASRSLTAGEIVDAAGGMTITTNHTGTTFSNGTNTTLINGSAITSTNGGATGVLDGSNLTLTNGANSTALTAGGATFTGAAGDSSLHGTETKINGGIITTDTLNVERINLGENILDTNGTPHGSNLSMDKQGNFSAAGGNFKVTGGSGADKGAMTNTVGNTTLQTDNAGASMKYNNGTVESNVSVGDNSAMVSAGASSIEVKNEGITNNGKTTFKGAVDATVPTTETTINGNTITTGHLITDKLTITGRNKTDVNGRGDADGTGSSTGSIAFGGDGSITSNIKDATTGKEATFKTDETGTFTEAKDNAGNKTTNTVNAQGNTNEVTDGTNTSTATQTATSIGGVVTNGTVKMRQELTAEGVKVTDELDNPTKNYTQITNKDVSITDLKNTGERINLSDLGQLKNLDGELVARDEYQDNQTAVGAINAEAGIRREEVARLDNRIDDVNNRVDKVGAMAAAIASLKSIGYDPQAPSEFSIGLGQYKGETGVAMGFFHYPNKNFMINVSLSTAGGETMGGIGATWRFGHKSPQKLLEEQREAQARKELAAAEKYQAAAKLAKEAQERAEYAAKLARQAQVSADNAKAAADATQAKHFQ